MKYILFPQGFLLYFLSYELFYCLSYKLKLPNVFLFFEILREAVFRFRHSVCVYVGVRVWYMHAYMRSSISLNPNCFSLINSPFKFLVVLFTHFFSNEYFVHVYFL